MLNIMSSEDDIQQDDQDDLQQDDEDDEDDDDQPITKRRKTDPTKWSDSDHKISRYGWRDSNIRKDPQHCQV